MNDSPMPPHMIDQLEADAREANKDLRPMKRAFFARMDKRLIKQIRNGEDYDEAITNTVGYYCFWSGYFVGLLLGIMLTVLVLVLVR